MVHFVERLGPISQEIDDCCRLVGIVSILEDEVNDGDKSMRAGSSRHSILARVIELGDVKQ